MKGLTPLQVQVLYDHLQVLEARIANMQANMPKSAPMYVDRMLDTIRGDIVQTYNEIYNKTKEDNDQQNT